MPRKVKQPDIEVYKKRRPYYPPKFKEKYKDKFLDVLEKVGGNVNYAIDQTNKVLGVDVSRSAVYLWFEKDERFKEKKEHLMEGRLDNIEDAIYRSAMEGNTMAQMFLLRTRGRDRGEAEKPEQSIQPVQIIWKEEKTYIEDTKDVEHEVVSNTNKGNRLPNRQRK
jgi:hypothetical protein